MTRTTREGMFPPVFSGLLGLMRPIEWTKGLGNMLLAVLTAAMLFPGLQIDWVLFAQSFASISLLWSGLYTLNDYTDWKQDAQHPVKKNRAIPAGKVSPRTALVISFSLVGVSLFLALSLSPLIALAWCAMLGNQLLYTLKPFNFKKRPVLDLVSGSLVNPVFRFYYGWLLFVPTFAVPLQVIVFMLGFQFGGYGLYRLMSSTHEQKTGVGSSVQYFGKKIMQRVFYVSLVTGGIAYFVSSLTIWKPAHAWVGIVMLVFLPAYWNTLKNPDVRHMHWLYWLVYLTYLVFLIGFVGVFLYF